MSPWGTVFVVDRTARVQEFTADGAYLGLVTTSSARNGGVDFGPGGELYVWSDDAFDGRILAYVRGPATTPAPPTSGATTVGLASRKVPVRKKQARLAVRCAGPTGQSCVGRAVVTGRAGGAKKSVPLARAAYAVEVGRAVVRMKLTQRGRAALKTRKRVTVRVVLVPRTGSRVTARATLKRR